MNILYVVLPLLSAIGIGFIAMETTLVMRRRERNNGMENFENVKNHFKINSIYD